MPQGQLPTEHRSLLAPIQCMPDARGSGVRNRNTKVAGRLLRTSRLGNLAYR